MRLDVMYRCGCMSDHMDTVDNECPIHGFAIVYDYIDLIETRKNLLQRLDEIARMRLKYHERYHIEKLDTMEARNKEALKVVETWMKAMLNGDCGDCHDGSYNNVR